jgi:hypothetical protein
VIPLLVRVQSALASRSGKRQSKNSYADSDRRLIIEYKVTYLYAPPSAVAMVRVENCRGRKQCPEDTKTRKTQGIARARRTTS